MDLKKKIVVGMADLNITANPGVLTTLGLGSCVGITLYDPISKAGGMAHCMLPNSTQITNNSNTAKFVDTAIIELINRMIKIGAQRRRLVAKIAGGAQMFSFDSKSESLRIGDRNVQTTLLILKQLGIRILSQDTGQNYGRTIELYTDDGRLVIKTIGKGSKVI